jgi:hypothetical protein
MSGYPMTVSTQELIAPRGSVAANDIDLTVGESQFTTDVVQEIKNSRIIVPNGSGGDCA